MIATKEAGWKIPTLDSYGGPAFIFVKPDHVRLELAAAGNTQQADFAGLLAQARESYEQRLHSHPKYIRLNKLIVDRPGLIAERDRLAARLETIRSQQREAVLD